MNEEDLLADLSREYLDGMLLPQDEGVFSSLKYRFEGEHYLAPVEFAILKSLHDRYC